MSVVTCLSAFDTATKWGYPYIAKVGEAAEKEYGYKVYRCEKENATQSCVYSKLKETVKTPTVFIGLGHGGSNVFTGQWFEYIFVACHQPKEAYSGWKVYLMYSCLTARGLGPDFVNKGVKAYWGWNHYALVGSPEHEAAWKLQDVLREAWIMWLSGHYTLGDCLKYAKDQWYKLAEEWKSKDPKLADAFKWQADHCIVIGDDKVKAPIVLGREILPIVGSFIAFGIGATIGALSKKIKKHS